MKVQFTNIKWDTDDGNGKKLSMKECHLPKTCVLFMDNDSNVEYEGADALSDKYGFCVISFQFKIV